MTAVVWFPYVSAKKFVFLYWFDILRAVCYDHVFDALKSWFLETLFVILIMTIVDFIG